MKKMMAGAAVAASLVGFTAAAAPQASATGNGSGTETVNGNHARDAYGNSSTRGDMSPQGSLVTDSLNKLCLGIPIKANIQQLIGLVNIVAIQDIPILSAPQNQQCTDNSTQAKGDEPISHILDDIPVLSSNGVSNE